MQRAWTFVLLCACLPGAASAQSRSTVTSWSFGFDLSAMSASSPASQGAVAAQCRLITERKAMASGTTSSETLAQMQEDCVRNFGR